MVASITRTLLYGAQLPAQYWLVAAVHAVYLMNRRVHSAIKQTPYEAWWDVKPDLSALKVFGSRVSVKVTGKRRAKLDRHEFTGIFVGYTATDENIRYVDVQTGMIKTSHHAIFDEAWYLQPLRPPAAQLLFDMGMEVEEDSSKAPPSKPITEAPWPQITQQPLMKMPSKVKNNPIPLRMSATPEQRGTTARAALTRKEEVYEGSILHPRFNKTDIITEMNLDKEEAFEQVYVSPSPYADAFEETIDLARWTYDDRYPAAGIWMIQAEGRVFLPGMDPSTPAARVPRWRSRMRGA